VRFLGREHELTQLARSLDAAARGRGSIHLVIGEPGIGKTRLADEVTSLAAARNVAVAWGRAWETGGAPPFYPWIEVLEALGGSEAGAPTLDAHGPARGESASADPARERFVIFDRVLAFLRSRTSPLLLVFDDLHAADLPSLELLHFVSRSLRSRRIVIVGTLRDAEGRRGAVGEAIARIGREATQIELRALGRDDVAKLVEEHTGRADAELTAELVRKTEGNPLFVTEALRAGTMLAPSSVLAVIASRIEGLDAETSTLLDAASVFGRRVVPATLASVTNTPIIDVVRRLGDLSARGVLRDDVFSHALVRDAFYARISLHRRRELHRAIATTLLAEGPKHAALAAHHMIEALPLVSTKEVIDASIAAAEAARARHAPEDAVTILERTSAAIEELHAPESESIELLLALGWAATESGSLARGRNVFRQASRRAAATGNAALIARAALGQGGELVFGEVRDELIAMLRGALEALPASAIDLRARLLARLAAALQPSTTPEEPVALALEAIEMSKPVTELHVRAEIALAAGSALVDFAPPHARIPVSEELVRTARAIDDAVIELRGLTRLATDFIEVGDFARAEGVIDARAEVAARIGHPRHLWQTPLLRSMLAMAKGSHAQCDEAIEEAIVIGQEGLDPNATHTVARHRFWMLLGRGDVEGLRAHMPDILRVMNRMPEPGQHHALVNAVMLARSGDAARARETLAGIGDGRRMLAPMMLATIADAALLADDTARFADLYAKLTPARGRFQAWGPFAFSCGAPYDALLGRLAERLGKSEAATAHLEAARELARRSGASLFEEPRPMPARLDFSLRIEGKEAIVVCNGRTTRLRSARGFPMLARLVEQPDRELHVLDLATDSEEDGAVVDRGDAGEVLDAKAREAYQQRINDLRAEIDEADRFADIGRADRARRELEMLLQQLSSAVGLGGRARRTGSATERARITVQRRVREAIKKIAEQEPELGRHLDWTIRTGAFCAYEPAGRK
jgi:tetratricopeptide (TPR) repeat protein